MLKVRVELDGEEIGERIDEFRPGLVVLREVAGGIGRVAGGDEAEVERRLSAATTATPPSRGVARRCTRR